MPGVIKIGVAGWAYKDWEGVVYPQTLHGAQRLAYLAEFFDLVEINTSFYRPITPAMGKQWCRAVEAVNPKFLFTAKLYRAFTHSPVSVVESTSAQTIHATKADERDAKAGFDSIACVTKGTGSLQSLWNLFREKKGSKRLKKKTMPVETVPG